MRLNMTQAAIHELVALCGSADLMVEVHQVRVLPQSGSAVVVPLEWKVAKKTWVQGWIWTWGWAWAVAQAAWEVPAERAAQVVAIVWDADDSEFPLDMAVEIYGIIYIYNPPDAEKLGVEEVTQDTVIDVVDGTMGDQPNDNAAATLPAGATTPPAGGNKTPLLLAAQHLLLAVQHLLPVAQRLPLTAQRPLRVVDLMQAEQTRILMIFFCSGRADNSLVTLPSLLNLQNLW